jgi:hypothetical protein
LDARVWWPVQSSGCRLAWARLLPIDWRKRKPVVGGPEVTLEEPEEFLRRNVPQPLKPARGANR